MPIWYPTLIEKAAVLCFALVQGHPFVDGNKRVGHAAMETFAGRISRSHLTDWLRQHVKPPA